MKLASFLTTALVGVTLYDHKDFKDISTTIGTTFTTLSTLGNPETPDFIANADCYIQSLSEEQLIELEKKISISDVELSFEDDVPKVKIKDYNNKYI